jgi:hypothetical protein
MERQVAEITRETCGTICHCMERALLRLRVPPTYVTYRAEYCHTRFYKENRMHLICALGSIYTHMIDKRV